MRRVRAPSEPAHPVRRMVAPILALLALLVTGTVGYVILGEADPLDALFMTVVTVSTVGYYDIVPLDAPNEMLFTMGLILWALVVTAWAVRNAADIIFAEYLADFRRRQRMERQLDAMQDHTVVCGYGRVGSAVLTSSPPRTSPGCSSSLTRRGSSTSRSRSCRSSTATRRATRRLSTPASAARGRSSPSPTPTRRTS
jgi:hypothetical protein